MSLSGGQLRALHLIMHLLYCSAEWNASLSVGLSPPRGQSLMFFWVILLPWLFLPYFCLPFVALQLSFDFRWPIFYLSLLSVVSVLGSFILSNGLVERYSSSCLTFFPSKELDSTLQDSDQGPPWWGCHIPHMAIARGLKLHQLLSKDRALGYHFAFSLVLDMKDYWFC